MIRAPTSNVTKPKHLTKRILDWYRDRKHDGRDAWLTGQGYKVLVRRQKRIGLPDVLCLVNLNIYPQGQGTLTLVLRRLEFALPELLVERCNPRLDLFLQKRGYFGDDEQRHYRQDAELYRVRQALLD